MERRAEAGGAVGKLPVLGAFFRKSRVRIQSAREMIRPGQCSVQMYEVRRKDKKKNINEAERERRMRGTKKIEKWRSQKTCGINLDFIFDQNKNQPEFRENN